MKVQMPQDFLDEPESLRKPKTSTITACEATLIREIPCNLTEMFFSFIKDQIESQFTSNNALNKESKSSFFVNEQSGTLKLNC
jgi:hypothetical protein